MGITRETIVEEANNDSTDLFSQLPVEIIQHIFYFLPLKDFVATRILSKTWRRISPVQHWYFSTECSSLDELTGNMQYRSEEELQDINRKFVDQSLQSFCKQQESVRTFSLYMRFSGKYVEPSKQLTVLILVTCELKDDSLSEAARLDSLHDLCLENVHLSDEILDRLISVSRNIKNLSLKLCMGIKFLRLLNLGRLEKVVVKDGYGLGIGDWIHRIKIEEQSLRTFDFHRRCKNDCEIDLKCCKNLEVLRLDAIILPGLFSENLFSDFPLLKSLFLCGQHKLEKFKISSPQLELLHLFFVDNLVDATIDTPSLRSFKYTGKNFLPFLLQMNTCRVQKSSLRLHCWKIDVSWFLKLRDFVGKQSHNAALSLRVTACWKFTFNLEELRGIPIPPVRGVKHLKLKLKFDYQASDSEALVDGIFWSCHPEMLTMELGGKQNIFIQYLKDTLQYRKEDQKKRCESTTIKCWRQDLKDVEIVQFTGTQKKKHISQRKMISFRFKW